MQLMANYSYLIDGNFGGFAGGVKGFGRVAFEWWFCFNFSDIQSESKNGIFIIRNMALKSGRN